MTQTAMEMVMQLPEKWVTFLLDQPESGMTYQILTVVLNDGRRFERVPYVEGRISLNGIEGFWKVPFDSTDISDVIVTHDRSGPPRLRK